MTEQGRAAGHDGVVVGLDGSRQATDAVDWAAGEAARRGARLHIISAIPMEYAGLPMPVGLSAQLVPKPLEGHVEDRLKDAKLRAVKRLPEDAVDVALLRRNPAPPSWPHPRVPSSSSWEAAATEPSRPPSWARLHRRGRALGVPGRGRPGKVEESERPRAVTVGVDGSEASQAAVAFAADAAARRGVPLHILCAWTMMSPGYLGYAYAIETSPEEWSRPLAEAASHTVDEAAGEVRKLHAGLVVREETPEMPASLALEEASRTSDLVVVGAWSLNVLDRALLGSVSRALLHHAACPVAVVRH